MSVTELFTTSDSAYLVDLNAETIDLPEGQEPAKHVVGVVASSTNGSAVVWISSPGFTDDAASSYVAGGNFIYFLSAVKWLCGAEENESTVFAPITLSTSHLTLTAATASLWSILLIFVLPIAVLAFGFVYWMKRRKK